MHTRHHGEEARSKDRFWLPPSNNNKRPSWQIVPILTPRSSFTFSGKIVPALLAGASQLFHKAQGVKSPPTTDTHTTIPPRTHLPLLTYSSLLHYKNTGTIFLLYI
jgi:hypothetical protein